MTQIAVGFKDATTGREKKTDGLWTHLGNMLLRTLTVTDKATLPAGTAQALIAQYSAIPAWSTAAAPWVETPVQATGVCTGAGAVLRIEYSVAWTHSGAIGAGVAYWGVGVDGGVNIGQIYMHTIGANFGQSASAVWYTSAPAGTHRFSVFTGAVGGTITFNAGITQSLYVTEQRI
jgi:hypothetical protein